MKTRMTIKIRKRTQPGWLVWLIIMMPFAFGFLFDLLGLPWMSRYLLDGAWGVLLLIIVCFHRHLEMRPLKGIVIWLLLFLVYTGAVYLVEFQSPLYYIWGLRNNFRFYFAFLAFALFLSARDVEGFFKLFDFLFWVNAVVTVFQFLVLELNGDYLGGVFGTEKGGNAYTNLFFAIMISKSLLFYLQKKESAWNCILKCVVALIVAAMAEIKFFFVEFVLILVLAVLFTDFTWRKFWIVIGGLLAVVCGAAILVAIFPTSAGFLTIEFFWERAVADKGYTAAGDLNRLNAIPRINELWLKNWGQRLFGLGLGNCDTSSFDLVNTPFYKIYGDMHYSWLSYAFMYLECGWIGLIFYFGFFVMAYMKARKLSVHVQDDRKAYCMLARIVAICCVLIAIYNSSLRTEAGYMAYFVLAIPYAIEREQRIWKRGSLRC